MRQRSFASPPKSPRSLLSMAQQSGATTRKKVASSSTATDAYTGEDRISLLPDDLLVLILLGLPTTAEAARTSVLSQRWRPVWKGLPELRFDNTPDLRWIRELIDVPNPDPEGLAPAELSLLSVRTQDADPESVAALLHDAARRVTGDLVFDNHTSDVEALWGDDDDDDEGEEAAAQERLLVRLPCFTKARGIQLDLGFLELALPSAGTFARLTELRLFHVVFRPRSCQLGDVVSSPRCPSLRTLAILVCHGIDAGDLDIRSESLLWIHLTHLSGFRRLAMVTPALQCLAVAHCLERYDVEIDENDVDNGGVGGGNANAGAVVGAGATEGIANYPIFDITAPQLEALGWVDKYDPHAVHFGNMEQLKQLKSYLYVYLQEDDNLNDNCQKLLQRFEVLETLTLRLIFQKDLTDDLQYVMEHISMLPKIMSLKLSVRNKSHAFGACCFHLLRMCTGIQRLIFQFKAPNMEVQYFCPSSCLCEEPTEWKTEKLNLMCLEEVVIINTNGTDHEIATFKHLFDWAVNLKRMKLKYHSSTESKANEVHQKLQSFARPETCITLEELPKQ